MWLLWDALLFSPYPFFSHFTNFWVVAEHQHRLSHKLLLSCLVSLSFSFRFLLLVIALYLYPQQPSETGVKKIPTHAHQHKWQDPYPLRIGPLVFIFCIFKEPSNLFLRMPIFKIFILTNLLIIPAIVAGVHFKTGQLLAPFSCTLKEEYKQIWTMYFQRKKKMKVAHSIKNLCTARVCIGKYILSILLKNKSRHWITEDNQGIGIKQEIDWYKKLWDEAINSKFKL